MGALSDDRNTQVRDGLFTQEDVAASAVVYAGGAVAIKSDGYADAAANTSGYKFRGIAQETVDNSAGQNGDETVKVQRAPAGRWAAAGMAQSDVGADVWWGDDQTVTTTPGYCYAGKIIEVVSATDVWVDHEPAYAARPGNVHAHSSDAEGSVLDPYLALARSRQGAPVTVTGGAGGGLWLLFCAAYLTEQLAGGDEDQAVITIYDGDDTSLGTIKFANAGADAVGDVRLGLNVFAASAGDATKIVAANKKLYAKVTTPSSGAGAAGKAKVAVIVLRLGADAA